MRKTPRPYQVEAALEVIRCLKEDGVNPVAVLPTGSGKSLVLCLIAEAFPDKHILVLSHTEDILKQDRAALHENFPFKCIGLFSAALNEKSINRITVGGVQSVWNSIELFDLVDLIIVDECHLVSHTNAGTYRKIINRLGCPVAGLTATPFRLGHGYIHIGEDALFNRIAINLSTVDSYNQLVDDGYLAKILSKRTLTPMDTKGIKKVAGDFSNAEMSERFDVEDLNKAICREIVHFGENYKQWLIFAIDIEHAEHLTELLNEMGIRTACVHSKMDDDRSGVLGLYRGQCYKAIVNVNVLTTGLDIPTIDLIAVVRPTDSPSLWVQIVGRGARTHPDKKHCLVLDFAGNGKRLGPINDVHVKQKGERSGGGGELMKECVHCQCLNPLSAKTCEACGRAFPPPKTKLSDTAGSDDIVRASSKSEWHPVDGVAYTINHKDNKPDSFKAIYRVGIKVVVDWVLLDHKGYPKSKAENWVAWRIQGGAMPKNVAELYARSAELIVPTRILVDLGEKFPEVKDCDFEEKPQGWQNLLVK